ncbi:signal peptidase I [Paenibacillus glycanilyticus]|uniref:Signal peptidase I n=1 Tax=Paenibacillus glycanilyticus TaxID=126569 RepID=A0ABQ6NFK9_9BACL|nr:signal peptidase I [Paenibacillus glycanilyticus]GMK43358.1 signal peptidase I [Paenibacillus glycanilyticus]
MNSQQHNEDSNQQTEAIDGSGLNTSGPADAKKGGRAYKEIVDWIKALAIAVILVFVIRTFLFSPFIVEGPSMEPNFYTGERLIVNKLIFKIREPHHGEVVVFHVPDQGRDFIKRVIGVPGDTIKVVGDDVFVNDQKVDEPYIKEAIEAAHANGELYNTGPDFPNANVSESVVPDGKIFAMGDHRGNSQDSRDIGFVSEKEVIGRADAMFWPLNKISIIKHYKVHW